MWLHFMPDAALFWAEKLRRDKAGAIGGTSDRLDGISALQRYQQLVTGGSSDGGLFVTRHGLNIRRREVDIC